MKEFDVTITDSYLKLLGEWNDHNIYANSDYFCNIENKIFWNGDASKLRYGWKDSINIQVSENNIVEFCSNTMDAVDNETMDCGTALEITKPLRHYSAIEYKENHIKSLIESTNPEQRKCMARVLGDFVRSTPEYMDIEWIMNELYKAVPKYIESDNPKRTWSLSRCSFSSTFVDNEDIDLKENEFFDTTTSGAFSTDKSTKLVNTVLYLRKNMAVKPKLPSKDDKVNSICNDLYDMEYEI